eukprot:symbB.v1.2.029811.t1/scaffold3301.1/size59484/4
MSLDRCAVVIDVREQYEWDAGHVSCATRLQIQKNPSNWRQDMLNLAGSKDTPIVAYCAAGVRAQSAVDMLVQEGYTDVTNGGGYSSQLEKVCQACAATTTSESLNLTSSGMTASSTNSSLETDFGSSSTVAMSNATGFNMLPAFLLLMVFFRHLFR